MQAARVAAAEGWGGRIVNIASVHEAAPRVGVAPYCAAQGGRGQLTRTAAIELARYGITVNAGAPGEIAAAMTGQEDIPGSPPPAPASRSVAGHAVEVGDVIAFLASRPRPRSSARRGPSTASCCR